MKIADNAYKVKFTIIIVFFCSILTGCSLIKSVQELHKGAECYDKGDFPAALAHLKESERVFDTPFPKTQDLLSRTYLALDDIDNAWYHARQATIFDCENIEYAKVLVTLWREIKKRDNITIGVQEKNVLETLGSPDLIRKDERYGSKDFDTSFRCFYYGLIEIEIISGMVDKITLIGPYGSTKYVKEWSDLF
jgi:hypothetical protein